MTEPAISAADRFPMGDVVSRSLGLFGRHFLPFFGLTGLVLSPNLFISLRLAALTAAIPAPDTLMLTSISFDPFYWLTMAGLMLLGLLLTTVLGSASDAAILHAASEEMSGRPVVLRRSIARAAARLFPILGTGAYAGLLITLGSLVLIVPGLVVLAMAAVAVPVCVLEGLGPSAAFWRSAALTQGYRWPVGLILVLQLLGGAVVSETVSDAVTTAAGAQAAAVAGFLIDIAFAAFGSVLSVVIYRALLLAKEARAPEGRPAPLR